MSRFALVCSLVAALTSSAFASGRFAQPPPSSVAASSETLIVAERSAVRAKLAAQRSANLTRFRVYQKKGVFPSNTYQNKKLNVWIDADGRLCAAATIISASGMQDLVAQTSEDNNFIRLGDVRDGALMDWILMSGLTQEEIAAIQEPFMPVTEMPRNDAPMKVAASARAAEDKRLAATYKAVEARIVRDTNASLDLATDRVMDRPDLMIALTMN